VWIQVVTSLFNNPEVFTVDQSTFCMFLSNYDHSVYLMMRSASNICRFSKRNNKSYVRKSCSYGISYVDGSLSLSLSLSFLCSIVYADAPVSSGWSNSSRATWYKWMTALFGLRMITYLPPPVCFCNNATNIRKTLHIVPSAKPCWVAKS
jgi:hypothetical protein